MDPEDSEFVPPELRYAGSTRTQRKEHDIYGIWAQDGSDDGGGGGTRAKTYSAPMSFVPSSSSSDHKEKEEGKEMETEQTEQHTGLGFGSSVAVDTDVASKPKQNRNRGGRSKTAAATAPVWSSWNYAGEVEGEPKGEGDDDEGEAMGLGLGMGINTNGSDSLIQSAMGFSGFGQQPSSSSHSDQPPRKKGRVSSNNDMNPDEALLNEEIAAMERHTRGMGSKLMAKMGFAGKLGRREQGISRPIEVRVRPKNLGLAAAGSERTGGAQDEFDRLARIARGEIDEEEEEEEMEEEEDETPGWRRTERMEQRSKSREHSTKKAKKPKKPKIKYVASSSSTSTAMPADTNIVDMRGPQTRVVKAKDLSDAVGRQREVVGGRRNLPELQYNSTLLVEMAEAEVDRMGKKLEFERNKKTQLTRERVERERALQEVQVRRRRVEEVVKIVQKIVDVDSESVDYNLDKLVPVLWALKQKYYAEWKSMDLALFVFKLVKSKFVSLAKAWHPLISVSNDAAGLALIRQLSDWYPIIAGKGKGKGSKLFARLIHATLLPPLRSAVTSRWNVHDPDALIDFCEALSSSAMPNYIVSHICDNLIVPRLVRAVDEWNPRTDTMPIHVWIHPWLPLLRDRLKVIYPTIRHKLTSTLGHWHPSDSSAHAVVSPWRKVFGKEEWSLFMKRGVVQRLSAVLKSEFKVNPSDQKLEPFKWVLEWKDLIRRSDLVEIVTPVFFPQFLQCLFDWLSQPMADLSEVGNWYTGWRSVFPTEWVRYEAIIRVQFNYALTMLEQRLDGRRVVLKLDLNREYLAYKKLMMEKESERKGKGSSREARERERRKPKTYKQIIEAKAAENNVSFFPINRTFNSHQLYRYGKYVLFIDKNSMTGEPCVSVCESDAGAGSSDESQWNQCSIDDI